MTEFWESVFNEKQAIWGFAPSQSALVVDESSILAEFDDAGLFEISEINENFPFFLIKCKKNTTFGFNY